MDQFAAMRAFVKVVETNGFSEAARQLQMAVSSITRQVNALEGLIPSYSIAQPAALVSHRRGKYYEQAVRILKEVESANVRCGAGGSSAWAVEGGMPVAFGRIHVHL